MTREAHRLRSGIVARRRGLSLFEVVVAMVIMGLAIPPLFIQIAADVRQQRGSLIQTKLTRLVSQRMWEIFADHADPDRGYDYVIDSAYPDESNVDGLTDYTRLTVVLEVSAADFITPEAGSGIKRFKITVTAPDGRLTRIESFVAEIPGAQTGP